MVGKNNQYLKKQKQGNKVNTYAIRRLSVGVASVAVAAGIFFASDAALVQAQETTDTSISDIQPENEVPVVEEETQPEAETVAPEEETQPEAEVTAPEEETQPEAEVTTPEEESQPEAATSAEDVDADSASENKVEAEEPKVALRSADSALNEEKIDNAVSVNNSDINISTFSTDVEKVQENAIYSPGQEGDTQSYSGIAYVYRDNRLNVPSEETIGGVNVYLQWVDKDGYVSNVYKTTSRPDGTYTFNFQTPEVDQYGNVHHFQLAGNPDFAIRTWVENPDPEKYNVIKPGDHKYGFHKRLDRVNESWDFTAGVNRIVGGQVALQEKIMRNDWLVKPRDQWTTSPNQDGIWPKDGNYGRVAGNVWYENGDPQGSIAEGWKKNTWDVNATGAEVVASYVNDEIARRFDAWKEANPNYGVADFRAAQESIIREYEAEHGKGSHIAETVVGKVDSNGEFYLPFRGLYGVDHKSANAVAQLWNTVSTEEHGTLVNDEEKNNNNLEEWGRTGNVRHRHINKDYMYVAPLIDNYAIWGNTSQNNMFETLTNNSTLPVGAVNLASGNIYNINFAALAAQPMHDVKVYDTQSNFAKPGETVQNETGGLLPSQAYKIRWFKDGNPIGEAVEKTSSDVGTIDSVPITVPKDLAVPSTYTSGVFYGNSDASDLGEALAADAFIAAPGVEYEPIEVSSGEKADTGTPDFIDKDGNKYKPYYEGQKAPKYEYVERVVFTDTNDQTQVEYRPLETVNVDGQDIKVSVDPETGVVSVAASETAKLNPGQKITVPVSIVFENGLRLTADSVINIIDDRAEKDKFEPNYADKNAEYGQPVTVDAPTFNKVDGTTETPVEINDVPLSTDPAKPAFKITEPANGQPKFDCAEVDPQTGAITIPADQTNKPGETIKVPVTVTYEDGSTDDVIATVTVSSPDVIDRSDDPDAVTPDGYHRVTLKSGEGVEDFGAKAYDVKDGSSIPADKVPTPQAKEGYENPVWNGDADVKPSEDIINGPKEYVATASTVQPVEDEKIADQLDPSYKDTEVIPGKDAETESPVFVDKNGKTVNPENPSYSIDTPTNGASIDPVTGKITIPAEETAKVPGQDINVPVTITYADGSTDQVTAKVKVTAPDVIDNTDDPNAPVPAGYHKVDFAAGEGVESLTNNKVYHVKDGVALTEAQYPTANPAEGYENPEWNVKPGTAITTPTTITATATAVPEDVARVDANPSSQNVLEGKDITPIVPSVTNRPEGSTVKVTIGDGQTDSGLTVDPDTGRVSGTPTITDEQWGTDEVREIPVTIELVDKDGQPVLDENNEPVKTIATIDVYRDTDKDGKTDKDTGMPVDPNNPDVPAVTGDDDDDNDGWTDQEEKDRNTDPKNNEDYPKVSEPDANNDPNKDTTTVTGKTTPDTKVEVKDKDGNTIGTGTSDENGNITVEVPKQNPGDKVTITPGKDDENGNFTPITDENGNPKGEAETVVTEAPQITESTATNEPDSDTTKVEGKTSIPNSKVEVKDKDGNTIGTGTSDENGNFTIEVPKQNTGDKVTVTPSKEFTKPDGTTESKSGDPVEITVTDKQVTPEDATVEVTPKSQNALEHKEITPVTPNVDNVPEGGSVKVTIDGQDAYPGLTVDPSTNQVSGIPEIKDWKDDEETRQITVEVTVVDKDGHPVVDADGNPIKGESIITIYRDTDKDGKTDKDTGMPVDPNNPDVPAVTGDDDDDNDGWTDQEEKDHNTDPKNNEDYPKVSEPDANNDPNKDTTTATGKPTPEKPDTNDSEKSAEPAGQKDANSADQSSANVLPATGENDGFALYGSAALAILAGLGLVGSKKREEE
ncbi:YSIRK signal domain/LPXTG anchor domain surface protein [Suicoccus acidiformans]|uniref:YSIRK signal domain/LPXTG anchor domain surface protein n=1 Tax=Suicoccus acidiformans TaxID=2036206 RepID=A0A347WJL6_9LACT|nr:YPDG domain-containing protein [Suicoccus acidiformans]AXY25273.1 YSIRK signal domain/LPXTG anchor domain surface protein [Suicoccus acidiformans]